MWVCFNFKLWNIFIFSRKFVCFLFSVSIIIVPFLKFLTVVDIIFGMRNGDNFVNGYLPATLI